MREFSYPGRSNVLAQNGMAATSNPLSSIEAINILKKGGNAIDAAIASNAAIGLMEPTGNGIGGDLFAIIWIEKEKKLLLKWRLLHLKVPNGMVF